MDDAYTRQMYAYQTELGVGAAVLYSAALKDLTIDLERDSQFWRAQNDAKVRISYVRTQARSHFLAQYAKHACVLIDCHI